MARATTPTFIVELPLSVTRVDAREMGVRLELGRQLYLGEGLRRLERLREGPAWARACAMPRIKARKPNKERAAAFAAARAAAGFTCAAISAFGTRCKNEAKWNDGRARTDARMGAHECQLIAQQAFSALERYAFGQRGRPRFKGKGRPLHSLQGKSADSGITPGFRAVPSLAYKYLTPAYADNATNPDGVSANAPGGGFTWDGRANTLAEQVAIPLLSSFEMANTSQAAVVQAVQSASYSALFQQAFGANVFSNTATAFTDIGLALQQYQVEDPSFHPFTSKYDYAVLIELSNGKPVTLTVAENRGYNVYLNPNGGNCFACHYNGPMTGGGGALFTDFTYQAIGAPRNVAIPANVTRPGFPPTYYDLGLCTAQNPTTPHTLPADAQYCGMFKVPTLRNVSTRQVFFHNGVFTSLAQLINFYNTRDTNPTAWYPSVGGVAQKFNDLPQAYHVNVDVTDIPFGLAQGATPYMSAQDMADLQCFLETLVDGYLAGVTPQDPNCVN